MRKDIRIRAVTLLKEYMNIKNSKDVNYKEFISYLKSNNELSVRIHIMDNKYMFGSLVHESRE